MGEILLGPWGLCSDAIGKRKVACDGSVPCLRCEEEDAKCIYQARPERSALTRVRMTELEEA